jgi:predicted acyl esterase
MKAIIVYQDVRGRWMSDGLYDNKCAFSPIKEKTQIDEASDTYDTIDWLVKTQQTITEMWAGDFYPGFIPLIRC